MTPPSPTPEPAWLDEEQVALSRVLPLLQAIQDEEREQDRALSSRMRDHHAAWTDAYGQKVDREALEGALEDDAIQIRAHRAARRAREIPLGTPYFARLVLREPKRKDQEVLLGKVGVLEKGIQIAGREREGEVAARRRVDIRDGVLVEAQRGEQTLRRDVDGRYVSPDEARARAPRDDHRLPDIVSLITREQFGVITRPDAGVVLLRGRAGSGKTTVALHRVAWLHFQDPVRFRPDRVLVVMFNKALQTYISRVLPDLGLRGVSVETFHGWAGRQLNGANLGLSFRPGGTAELARLKRHPAMADLIDAHLAALGERSASWLAERLPPALVPTWERLPGVGLARIAALRQAARGAEGLGFEPLWRRLRTRLLDHGRDLATLFDDADLCRRALPATLHGALPEAAAAAARSSADRVLQYEDAALILRLGQRKMALDPDLPCAWAGRYGHVVIDEAQDLSTLEIASLVDAADSGRSVTIAGDPAQKILADAQFEGFEALLERLGAGSRLQVRLDALAVGHRSTRPIMELALKALGGPPQDLVTAASRDGEPVVWLDSGDDEGVRAAAAALGAFRTERATSLVAVLCRQKSTADRWAAALTEAGLTGVRRAERSEFQFHPGVVVSNVHQVKGLEFDGVLLVDPADYGTRDRHLLHVAITRAADRLWVACPRGPGLLR